MPQIKKINYALLHDAKMHNNVMEKNRKEFLRTIYFQALAY
jgi:hypothetical protein